MGPLRLLGRSRGQGCCAANRMRRRIQIAALHKEMTRLFPSLRPTEKAAERWLGNNPLNPLISIIRLWGVIAGTIGSGGDGDGGRGHS
jgi:hypothetical protein